MNLCFPATPFSHGYISGLLPFLSIWEGAPFFPFIEYLIFSLLTHSVSLGLCLSLSWSCTVVRDSYYPILCVLHGPDHLHCGLRLSQTFPAPSPLTFTGFPANTFIHLIPYILADSNRHKGALGYLALLSAQNIEKPPFSSPLCHSQHCPNEQPQ